MSQQYEQIDSESALLIAVRDQIRELLDYLEDECEVEYTELTPAAVGQVYVAITGGGLVPGPAHAPSEGTVDQIFSINVTVIVRAENTPRDRQRKLYLGTAKALNLRLELIRAIIDQQWSVVDRANTLLTEAGDTAQGFLHWLVWEGGDPKPRAVGNEVFGSAVETTVGLARTFRFGKAQRMQIKQVTISP